MDHNNLIDFGADMLSKIVNDVETEPELQLVTREIIEGLSGNPFRTDITAPATIFFFFFFFFDVTVTNIHFSSKHHLTTESVL